MVLLPMLLALTGVAGATMAPCPLIKRTGTVSATHDDQVRPSRRPFKFRYFLTNTVLCTALTSSSFLSRDRSSRA